MIKVSDYIFKFLEKKGVKQAFMLPGGGAMHLVDSLGNSSMSYVCFQHEQGASIAAESYGQHTNKPALLLVTSGPGATNAITGVTAGWIDSTPMFVISGQAKRSDLVGDSGVRQVGSQEVQIVEMVKPITKYAVQIMKPEEIRYHLEKAYMEATTGRPGPVWLSIPLDVQGSSVEEEELEGYVSVCKKSDHNEKICMVADKVIQMLKEARKPIAIAGNGIKLADAIMEWKKIVEKLQIPVLTTWKTIDMFVESDELYVGHPGIMGDRGANLNLQEADFILSVGSRLDTSITAFNEENFGKNAKKVIVDIDENELKKMKIKNVEEYLSSDAKEFLQQMLLRIEALSSEEIAEIRKKNVIWLNKCNYVRSLYPVVTEEHKEQKEYVSAYYFTKVLCDNLREDDIIVPESSGGAGEITYQAFQVKKGQKIKNAAGLGSMGFGLPYAIGACIANDYKRTVLINGDGAFQLNIQELETLHRLQLPVKMFIWSNGGYASIRNMQKNTFDGHLVASDEKSGMSIPQTGEIAKAYGFKTHKINNNSELEKKLPSILSEDGACLCEVLISPDETVMPRVKAIKLDDGKMISGPLENMWPYLEETDEIRL